MPKIMKIIDERERQQKAKKGTKGDASYSESVRAKWFCCGFKLGFLQLICKASFIFKSHLELALSFFYKKDNYMSQSMLWWSIDV